ncbi:MAG: hypothetical protein A2Y81_11730 [Nitrospirae bacterium RBG_13_43_8]|nr:MAG: hypothetical protein A2Y81_11730 [Nitrospirae bacterium RBG_13_43_8]
MGRKEEGLGGLFDFFYSEKESGKCPITLRLRDKILALSYITKASYSISWLTNPSLKCEKSFESLRDFYKGLRSELAYVPPLLNKTAEGGLVIHYDGNCKAVWNELCGFPIVSEIMTTIDRSFGMDYVEGLEKSLNKKFMEDVPRPDSFSITRMMTHYGEFYLFYDKKKDSTKLISIFSNLDLNVHLAEIIQLTHHMNIPDEDMPRLKENLHMLLRRYRNVYRVCQ